MFIGPRFMICKMNYALYVSDVSPTQKCDCSINLSISNKPKISNVIKKYLLNVIVYQGYD